MPRFRAAATSTQSKPVALTAMKRNSDRSIASAETRALLVMSIAASRERFRTSSGELRSWISTSPSGVSAAQELPSAASV
jgi:hypothetical protein